MKYVSPFVCISFALMVTFTTGCSKSDQPAKDKMYDVKGKVVTVNVEKGKVTLDHEAIPGLMGAMTMPFDVENAKLLDGLKAGDQVHGKLKVQGSNYTLVELMKH